ncbi:MAG: GGDEF domain-containing protein [Terracidiphilus sp.]
MCASHAYVSFDTPAPPDRLPFCEAIRGLAGMAGQFADRNENLAKPDDSSVAVLVDAEVDGSRYLLVRMPGPTHPHVPAVLPRSGFRRHKTHGSHADRRLNIGGFRRVLLADNDDATRLRLQHLLCAWGFDISVAQHGIEALKVLHQQPDLVIVRHTLPGIDCLDLCRQLTNRSNERSPYIFVLGESSDRQEILGALDSGASAHLTAPIDEQELRARLVAAVRTLEHRDHLIVARDEFRDQAMRDALTGVSNRRAILEVFENELRRARRNRRSTGVLMLDLDNFKSVNDAYGHLAGDMVLQQTSRRLQAALRSYDSLGRFGGEEFLVVVPGAEAKELCELAERLRFAIESLPMKAGQNTTHITVSVGAAVVPAGKKSVSEIVAVADCALYKAKKLGRNRVIQGEL